jgi:integrase
MMLSLKEETKLSHRTINYIFQAVRVPLAEAYRLGIIQSNPGDPIQKFGTVTIEKGILNSVEVSQLLNMTWPDKRIYAAFLVALFGGLRLGEIIALTKDVIQRDAILVAHSYSKTVGLKTTKTNKPKYGS